MSTPESMIPQTRGPGELSPDQRRQLMKEAKDFAKERMSIEDRKKMLKEAKSIKAKDEQMVENISAMIEEHSAAPDAFPKMALRPEDFAKPQEAATSKVKTRKSVELGQAVEVLKDPKRAREIYEQTKINEEVDKAIEGIREDKDKKRAA